MEDMPRGDGNMYHCHLSKLYHPEVRRITSENFIKIGSQPIIVNPIGLIIVKADRS